MNVSVINIFPYRKAAIYIAFALAMLVLVVSCPVKRLLLSDFNSTASSSTKTNQANLTQGTSSDYSAVNNCCLAAKETGVAIQDLSQQLKLPVPLYFSNIGNQSGFDINYFLSGINVNSTHSVAAQHVTLPLFLQHLRLLI